MSVRRPMRYRKSADTLFRFCPRVHARADESKTTKQIVQQKGDNLEDSKVWVERTVKRILRESGPRAAQRFIASRGGAAKWEAASREIARALRLEHTKKVSTSLHAH